MHKIRLPVLLTVIAGVLSLLCYCFLTAQGDLRKQIPLFKLIYLLLFFFYIITITALQNQDNSGQPILFLVIMFAVCFRLSILASEPSLSSDIYRYHWDGKLSFHGYNPYNLVPDSQELNHLKDKAFTKMEHTDTFTIYPPLAEITFLISYLINPSIFTLKTIFTFFDVGIIILLYAILKTLKKNSFNIIIYAWNPLAIIEISGSGHLDAQGIFWLLLCILLCYKKMALLSAASLLLATLSKPIILPALFLLKKIKFKTFLLLCMFAVFVFLPLLNGGIYLFKGMAHYLFLWEFNGSIFPVLLYVTKSYTVAKTIIAVMLLIIISYLLLKKVEFPKAVFILIGTILMISPTVYPWYILWILPFICIFENISWLILSLSIIFSYSVFIDYLYLQKWQETLLTKLQIYLPFYGMLVFELFRSYVVFRRGDKCKVRFSSKSKTEHMPMYRNPTTKRHTKTKLW